MTYTPPSFNSENLFCLVLMTVRFGMVTVHFSFESDDLFCYKQFILHIHFYLSLSPPIYIPYSVAFKPLTISSVIDIVQHSDHVKFWAEKTLQMKI